MKCPSCKFVCSELRDLCPSCLVDLRPYKKSMGLPISFPQATYKELASKTSKATSPVSKPATAPNVKAVTPKADALQKKKESSGFFAKLLGVSGAKGPEAPHKLSDLGHAKQIAPESPIKHKATQTPQPTPKATPQAKPLATSFETATKRNPKAPAEAFPIKRERVEFEVIADSAIDQQTRPPSRPPAAVTIPTEKLPSTPTQLETEPLEPGARGPRDREPKSVVSEGAFAKTTIKAPLPTETLVFETEPIPLAAEPSESVIPEPAISEPVVPRFDLSTVPLFSDLSPQDDVEKLFLDAYQSVKDAPIEFEFSAMQFLPNDQNKNEIEVLFDLAREFLINPEAHKQYVREVTTKADFKIDSPALMKELERTERELNAPKLGLKGSGKGTQLPKVETRPVAINPASIFARLFAFVLDLLIPSFATILFVFAFVVSTENGFESLALGDFSLDIFDYVHMAALLALLLVPAYVLVTLASFCVFKTSLGGRLLGLTLLTDRGFVPGFYRLCLRSLSMPLSIISGGFLPAIVGWRTLHDWTSETVLTRAN